MLQRSTPYLPTNFVLIGTDKPGTTLQSSYGDKTKLAHKIRKDHGFSKTIVQSWYYGLNEKPKKVKYAEEESYHKKSQASIRKLIGKIK